MSGEGQRSGWDSLIFHHKQIRACLLFCEMEEDKRACCLRCLQQARSDRCCPKPSLAPFPPSPLQFFSGNVTVGLRLFPDCPQTEDKTISDRPGGGCAWLPGFRPQVYWLRKRYAESAVQLDLAATLHIYDKKRGQKNRRKQRAKVCVWVGSSTRSLLALNKTTPAKSTKYHRTADPDP